MIAILAIVAFATSASPVAGQTIEVTRAAQTIEVIDEASGAHCGAVTVTNHAVSGGCPLQVQSVGEVTLTQDHSTTTNCLHDLEARVDEGGYGYIYDQALTDGPSQACFVSPCAEPGGGIQPWDIKLYETASDDLQLDVEVCVEDIFFHGVAHSFIQGVDAMSSGHDHLCYNAPNLTGEMEPGGEAQIDGSWESTVDTEHPELEITHL